MESRLARPHECGCHKEAKRWRAAVQFGLRGGPEPIMVVTPLRTGGVESKVTIDFVISSTLL